MGRNAAPWLVALIAAVAVGAGAPAWSQAREAARYAVTAEDLAAGRAALDALVVRGRAPTTGYARERFGQEVVVVDGGHLSALSHPDQIAAAILHA